MANQEVEEFAKLLIEHVRDMAISSCDLLRNRECSSVRAKRWRRALDDGNIDEILEEVIPDCVDNTIFHLLYAIDEEVLKLSFTSSSGQTVDLGAMGDSEMSGWYMGTQGWREMFSKERFSDDFKDLS